MKKLQSDLTTPEQSKRLLELGVPADSANYYYDVLYDNDGYFWRNENHPTLVINDYEYDTDGDEFILPCWSAGRLIEILKICITDKNELREIFDELEMCIDETAVLVQTFKEFSDVIDFSKLDE